ncbi:SIMPL domain-containing protein [Aquimarina litoralis]|uniref:SIMPL domain-containing protein n=1 Tax=Aquimarina litoralis TaxID=584605 RepID=UPI001FEA090C|nr:SIMPL domain-containing protein [Aquimarina litoralis]
MKKYIIVLLVLLSILGFSQEKDFSRIPQIQTKATYTTEVAPDKIVLSILLKESNTRGKVSVEELEKRLEMVLQSNDIDIQSQLRLVTLSSNFRSFFLKKTDVYKSKSYELELKDLKLVGKILRDLESQKISNVDLSKTEYTKLEELKIELKSKAVLKAKKQAEEMAKALNQSIGKAIFISDVESNINAYQRGVNGLNVRRYSAARMAAAYEVNRAEAELEVEFDKIKVAATVTVHFRLE